eukprot:TRINITY_DN7200_c0_g1_i1.p1 TRINITY_DN7200_c0_g1~~TRINITY_DN7200_c0_g1_i1.p1  ORF type:complete len:1369 (-),score=389.59 TRINITY_DN7200_c0_g1_i1:20-4126(-)
MLAMQMSYVPRRIVQSQVPLDENYSESINGVVMAINLEGWKKNHFSSDVGRDYLDHIVTISHHHGGDVITLNPFTCLVIWSEENTASSTELRLAILCASTIANRLDRGDNVLKYKITIDHGQFFFAVVGGYQGRWEHLLSGDAVQTATSILPLVPLTTVVCTKRTKECLKDTCRFKKLENTDIYQLMDIQRGVTIPRYIADADDSDGYARLAIRPGLRKWLDGFIPECLRHSSDEEIKLWSSTDTSSIRFSTTMCLTIPGLQVGWDTESCVQKSVLIAQSCSERYQGKVGSVWADETGLCIVCIFSMENHCYEAISSALLIRNIMSNQLPATRFGISLCSGRVYGASFGNKFRRSFSWVSKIMHYAYTFGNLAAKEYQSILVNSSLFEHLLEQNPDFQHSFTAVSLPKDFPSLKIGLYKLTGVPTFPEAPRTVHPAYVARRQELSTLISGLHALKFKNHRGSIIIEGEAGSGKSFLIEEMEAAAASMETLIIKHRCLPHERALPYFLLKGLLDQIFKAQVLGQFSPRGQGLNIKEQLGLFPELNPVLPALSIIYPDVIPAIPDVSVENQHQMLKLFFKTILLRIAKNRTTSLVIEDWQWADSFSAELIQNLGTSVGTQMLMIFTGRVGAFKSEMRINSTNVTLGPVSHNAASKIVSGYLEVRQLPDEFSGILEIADGNPGNALALVYKLKKDRHIRIEHGTCHVELSFKTLIPNGNCLFPERVKEPISALYDSLPIPDQIILEVASILDNFDRDLIVSIQPPLRNFKLETYFEHLMSLGIILKVENSQDTFLFSSWIWKEMIYQSIPTARQVQLHYKVAKWFENNLPESWTHLARHFFVCREILSDVEQANLIDYLDKAAAEMNENRSPKDTIYFASRALIVAKEMDTSPTRLQIEAIRIATWHLHLGNAYFLLEDISHALDHTNISLETMGENLPDRSIRGTMQMMTLVSKEFFKLGWGTRDPSASKEKLIPVFVTFHVKAWWLLCDIYFHIQDSAKFTHALFAFGKYADILGPSEALLKFSADMLYFFSLNTFKYKKWSVMYFQDSQAILEKLDSQEAKAYLYGSRGISLFVTSQFSEAKSILTEASQILTDLPSLKFADDSVSLSLFVLSIIYCLEGDFPSSVAITNRIARDLRFPPRIREIGTTQMCRLLFWMGKSSESTSRVFETRNDLPETSFRNVSTMSHKAVVLAYFGNELGFEVAKKVLDLLKQMGSFSCHNIILFEDVGSVFIREWTQRKKAGKDDDEMVALSKSLLNLWKGFAKNYSIFKISLLTAQCRFLTLRGDNKRAISVIEEGLKIIKDGPLTLPFYHAVLLGNLGDLLNRDDLRTKSNEILKKTGLQPPLAFDPLCQSINEKAPVFSKRNTY